MKKKQFMSKLAALTMAAAMGLTAVPATALNVMADSATEDLLGATIDDTTSSSKEVTVSVTTQGSMSEAEKTEIKTITQTVHNAHFQKTSGKYDDKIFDENKALVTGAADYVKGFLKAEYDKENNASNGLFVAPDTRAIVSGVSITDPDNWSYTVTDPSGVQATVTVKTSHAYTLIDDVTDLLDEYFENTDYTTYKDQNLTSRKIANDLNANTDKVYTNASKTPKQTIKDALSSYGVTISGDETLVKDGKGTIKAVVAKGETGSYKTDGEATTSEAADDPTINYSFTINLEQKADDEKTALKNAIATLNGSTYADPGTQAKIQAKVAEDLIAAGAPKGTTVSGTYKAATATADGSWYCVIDNTVLNLTLKYSSASKLSDTDKSIRKALNGASKSGDTKTWKTGNKSDGYDEKEGRVYNFEATSKFSLGLQKKDATTAAKVEDIKAALEKAVNDQLTADKVTDNGVQVTEVYRATINGASKAATSRVGGDTFVVISASIRNDFYGWTTGVPATNSATDKKNVTINYLVDVTTGELKSVETTALALDDQVVELVPNVDYDAEKGRFTKMLVSINPTVTPENGNDEIKYVLKDQYGNKVTTDHQGSYVDADGNEKTCADNEFLFSTDEGGKYTVEISLTSDKNVKASASLTVKDSFNDGLDKTKYYRPAVKWAYETKISNGVGDGNFGVNQTTSRAQFVTWLYKIAEKAGADMTVNSTVSSFSDVNSSAYYANAVAWAAQHGIVSGTSATTFSPNASISRAQMVTIIYRLNGSDVNITVGNNLSDKAVNFTDIAGRYYTTPVTWAANNGIVSGKTTTTFAPNDNATRAEAIKVLYNAFNEVVK